VVASSSWYKTRTSSEFLEENVLSDRKRHTRFVIEDDQLARIAAAWPNLPESIRKAMLAIIDSTS
jgi:hypothetical protein